MAYINPHLFMIHLVFYYFIVLDFYIIIVIWIIDFASY